MLILKLNHVSKRGYRSIILLDCLDEIFTFSNDWLTRCVFFYQYWIDERIIQTLYSVGGYCQQNKYIIESIRLMDMSALCVLILMHDYPCWGDSETGISVVSITK